MIKITFSEETRQYVVLLNGVTYTSCDTLGEAKKEASRAMHEMRYGL